MRTQETQAGLATKQLSFREIFMAVAVVRIVFVVVVLAVLNRNGQGNGLRLAAKQKFSDEAPEGLDPMHRKHKILILLFLPALLLWSNACVLEAQEKTLVEPAPQIFFPETAHDFGTISRGGSVSHVFAVRNTGSTPLELIGVKDT